MGLDCFDDVEHLAVLVPQDLLLLLVRKISARDLLGIGRCLFPDAAAAYEHLGLQDEFVFARFALHVINGIALLHIGIKTKNHAISIHNSRNACMSVKTLSCSGRGRLTLLPANSNLERLS